MIILCNSASVVPSHSHFTPASSNSNCAFSWSVGIFIIAALVRSFIQIRAGTGIGLASNWLHRSASLWWLIILMLGASAVISVVGLLLRVIIVILLVMLVIASSITSPVIFNWDFRLHMVSAVNYIWLSSNWWLLPWIFNVESTLVFMLVLCLIQVEVVAGLTILASESAALPFASKALLVILLSVSFTSHSLSILLMVGLSWLLASSLGLRLSKSHAVKYIFVFELIFGALDNFGVVVVSLPPFSIFGFIIIASFLRLARVRHFRFAFFTLLARLLPVFLSIHTFFALVE